MLKKLLTTFLVMTFVVSLGLAQTGGIQGTVTDAKTGETVPGANVVLTEITKGTSTGPSGEYSITEVPSGTYTLRITFVGFKPFEAQVQVESGETITKNVQLQSGSIDLNEVVVTGYQTRTKTESSISASSVSSEDLKTAPNSSASQSLTGKVAGLNITTSSGQPGADPQINLRGVSSLNGNTEPLILLDGTPVNDDNIASLNPSVIENVTVLKDAGATAIYGTRGANGVILIQTKTGSYNSGVEVDYTAELKSTSLRADDYDRLSGPEQLQLEQDYLGGNVLGLTPSEFGNAPDTDWIDYFFDPALSTQHSLSVSNGKENIKTYTAFGFTNQDGALNGSRLRRFNIRNNITGRSSNQKFNFGVNTSINFNNDRSRTGIGGTGINQNPLLAAKESVPYLSPEDYPGNGADLITLSGVGFAYTPLYLIDKRKYARNGDRRVKVTGAVNGSYQLTEELEANLRVGGDYERNDNRNSRHPESFNSIIFAETGNNFNGQQQAFSTESLTYDLSTSLQYRMQFNEIHDISAGAYFEMSQGFYEFSGFTNNGIVPNTFAAGDGASFIGDGPFNDWFKNPVSLNKLQSGLLSYFGTVDYSYADRYGASLTLRRDASYRFSDSNKWGTFYAISGRWNISNESFMDDMPFDVLKLRASYGKSGNQNIVGAQGQFSNFGGSSLTKNLFASGNTYKGAPSIFFAQLGNSELKWEEVIQTNVGIDFELFDSRLVGSLEGYVKQTDDLFQSVPLSALTGQTSINTNVGSLENRGFEFDVSYDFLRSRDGLNLTVGILGSYNKQEILDLPQEDGQIVNGLTTLREGGPLGEFYVYPYEGVNPDNGNLLFRDAEGNLTENPSAAEDRRTTGKNIYPDWQGSLNFDLSYKGLYLQTQWQYAVGIYRFDFQYAGYVNPNNIGQFVSSRDILDSWTPQNTDASQPRYNAPNRSLDGNSDRFLVNSDYVRLRHATLGYQLPSNIVEKANIRGVNIYVSAENLLTFTEWRGLDPETLNATNSRLYPNPRIVSVGLEIQL
ncbi:SusC/RagA family TonB-linked outer membrane protein [Fodinibius halophilus]|uniref:SusC/RagA family TonB-linked outer membrane protein n=1 Tax=Fodinibius halophilus TaxID=1736908 RepID=A0A6M1T7A0_9BACT|nr:SusC/RagA family TonB-linked outer membrane protein [Fodinibius halophilus]NGP90077.1 SusC/RagA family TonB-linked outer membrane protein [Fodinibius halophilus]